MKWSVLPLGETLDGASNHLRWQDYVNDFFCVNFRIWLRYSVTVGDAVFPAICVAQLQINRLRLGPINHRDKLTKNVRAQRFLAGGPS
jgi:hypothetical protein